MIQRLVGVLYRYMNLYNFEMSSTETSISSGVSMDIFLDQEISLHSYNSHGGIELVRKMLLQK
jgi:hypothetical protein